MISFFLLFIGLGISQVIQHNPIESSLSNEPINFNVFIANNEKEIDKVVLMYKNIQQFEYLNKEMVPIGNNNFNCVLTDHFANKLDINYFFIVEFKDGGVLSHRVETPYLIDINHYEDNYWEEISSNENIDLLVLSPLPNSKVNSDNLIVAVSMFSVKHIDVNNIKVIIDSQNVTEKALITNNFISISDLNLSKGNHIVSIEMVNKFGIKYHPYSWSFEVINSKKDIQFNKKIKQKLKYWSSYSESYINQNNIEYYDHNLMYNINFEWLKLKSNFKISSLEDISAQAKNRYSLTLNSNSMKLDLGDFYPYFNTYILNGSRVRGLNFSSTYSEYKYLSLAINFLKGELNRAIQGDPLNNSVYISDVDTLNGILTIDRDNYTFKRELSALKLTMGLYEKMFLSLNFFKAKDNINSVYTIIPDSEIQIKYDFISDFNNLYLNKLVDEDIYGVPYNNFISNYSSFIYGVDSIKYLADNWGGSKPKDNFIVGSELLFNLDEGKTIIHSEFNISMLNENLWNSITEISQLDTLGSDTIQDGLFFGNSLSEAEKLLEYNDIFQLGFNQVPYFPIDISSNNIFKALFNMPSAIYEFDSKFNYGNHSIKYMYEKIGSEFNSLGNLYIQTNISKISFSDRMRFFENRLYIYMKYTIHKEIK